jgi:uncharacterized protein (DUF302 family)
VTFGVGVRPHDRNEGAPHGLPAQYDSDQPFQRTLEATRSALVEQGFGILTEVDLADVLKARIGAEIPAQVILGVCRPPLAHAAVRIAPSIGPLLPCNVVVRALDDGETLVEAVDPMVMVTLTGNADLEEVAVEARDGLTTALVSLDGTLTARDAKSETSFDKV